MEKSGSLCGLTNTESSFNNQSLKACFVSQWGNRGNTAVRESVLVEKDLIRFRIWTCLSMPLPSCCHPAESQWKAFWMLRMFAGSKANKRAGVLLRSANSFHVCLRLFVRKNLLSNQTYKWDGVHSKHRSSMVKCLAWGPSSLNFKANSTLRSIEHAPLRSCLDQYCKSSLHLPDPKYTAAFKWSFEDNVLS